MSIKRIAALVMALGLLGALIPASVLAAPGSSYWSVAGTYNVDVTIDTDLPGTVYKETLVLTQSGTGTITGTSLCCALFTISTGSVVGNAISFDGVYGNLKTRFTGVIAVNGSMSGRWMDVIGGSRTGHWATTSGHAALVTVSSHQKTDLVPYANQKGPAVGSVIFNSSSSNSNNLELTVQLKKVAPRTSYDVWLFLDSYASGRGHVVGSLMTNGVGNATLHVNTHVSPGIHTVAIDVTLHGSSSDVFVTPGLYGQNLYMFFK
jgi:hypothetical protein